MNLKEGTRRLALLLGIAGASFGCFVSYIELQPTLEQRARHNEFERLADSDVVKQGRKSLQAATPEDAASMQSFQYIKLPDGSYGKFRADADDAAIVAAIQRDFPQTKPWLIYQSLAKRNGGPDFIPEKTTPSGKTPPAPATYTKQQGKYSDADIDSWSKEATGGTWKIWQPTEINRGGIKSINWNKGFAIESIETEDGQTLYPTPAPVWWSYALVVVFPFIGFVVPWGVIRAVGWAGAGFVQPPK